MKRSPARGCGSRSLLMPIPVCLFLLVSNYSPAFSGDWPQYRGPSRNGISSEKGWSTRWPKQGPKVLWKTNVGKGYSCMAISGGRLYTMGNKGDTDAVCCLDANTGRAIWRHSYKCPAKDYPGPRATPTVNGGRVYTLSREGNLFCLDAKSGKVVWSRNLKKDHKLNVPGWGFASSPLVDGNLLLLNLGTAGLAVDKQTGKTAWQTGNDASGYASPVLGKPGGQRCVALFARNAIVGADPKTGKQLWRYTWQTSSDVNAADPIIAGNKVFISSNYGKGCALLNVGKGKATVAWQNRNMKNHFSSSVLVKGFLYGNDEGSVRCLDFGSGAAKWNKGGLGKGQLMAADGKLIILSEHGELAIALASPGGYKELARAQVLGGTCWTAPVLSGGKIYCRNQDGDLICLNVKG